MHRLHNIDSEEDSEWLFGKDVEGSSCVLFDVLHQVFLEGVTKTMRNISQYSWPQGRELKDLLECEIRVLTKVKVKIWNCTCT